MFLKSHRGEFMKNALLIALTLTSVAAFAGPKASKEARKEAFAACKAEGKTKKDLKACVKAKLATPAAEATEAAPSSK